MKGKKLYIIGIDSAPEWIIRDLCKKHSMKGFERFIKGGTLMEMKSTLPPLTPVAWPSIYTGLNPSEHGVMDFFSIDKSYTKQLSYFDQDAHKTFWASLSDEGLSSLVITPPTVLKLSHEDNVDMVTGWPLQPRYSSVQLEQAAKSIGFSGEAEIEKGLQSGKVSLEEARVSYVESIRKRAEFAKLLMSKKDYDMVFVTFTETDRIQHYSLNRKDWEDYTAPLYSAVSDFIEWVVKEKMDSNSAMIIVSDHGAYPVKKKFLLNGWLIKKGFTSLKPEVRKSMDNPTKSKGTEISLKYKLREGIVSSGARKLYDKMPQQAKKLAGNVLGSTLGSASGGEFTRIHDFDLDMKSTTAFTSISNDPVGMIWINDDRFSSPVVAKGEKEKLKRRIIEELKAIKTEEGDPLIQEIYDGSGYYGKTKSFIPPDILLRVKEGYIADVKNYSPKTDFMDPELAKSGDHTLFGIFGAIGSGLPKMNRKAMNVLEVNNIVLKYFGI
jgi:predicted AlkP superfamily phosphohydrolase/phosphomutase